MDTIEWITIPQMSREYETGNVWLHIEVRIYEQGGDLYAEPLYYKYLDDDDSIIMDGSHASRTCDRMWPTIQRIVESEYKTQYDWFIREHPAFEALRRERQIEASMDRDWYISRVL